MAQPGRSAAITSDGVDRGGQRRNRIGIKASAIEPRTATPSGLARRRSANRAVSRRTWPMTSWPRRRAVRISEPRMYQASSSRQTGPRAPAARSRPLAMAILPALPELRHRPVTSGTERGRSRHDSGQRDEALAQHERRPVGLGRMVKADRDTGRLGRTPGCQRIVNDDEAPPLADLPPDDPAQRRDQAEQPEPAAFEHPVVSLPT